MPEKFLKAYVSMAAPNSYSDPMTFEVKGSDFEYQKSKRNIYVCCNTRASSLFCIHQKR